MRPCITGTTAIPGIHLTSEGDLGDPGCSRRTRRHPPRAQGGGPPCDHRECAERGLRLAVASSSPLRIIDAALRRFELQEVLRGRLLGRARVGGQARSCGVLHGGRVGRGRSRRLRGARGLDRGDSSGQEPGMLCVAVPEVRSARDETGLAVADVVLGSLEGSTSGSGRPSRSSAGSVVTRGATARSPGSSAHRRLAR